MHVLFLTTNTEFLKDRGAEQTFLDSLVRATDVLHVVVYTKRRDGYKTKKLNDHAWVYPTNSFFGFKAFSMMRTARFQVSWQGEFRAHVIYSDDVRESGWAGAWLAFLYEKIWVVNIRSYEWGARALRHGLFGFVSVMPLFLVLSLAHKLCVFSDLAKLYLSITAAHREDKIVMFPRVYDAEALEKESVLFDIKTKYPRINFSLVVATTLAYRKHVSLAFSTLALLRKNPYYARSGLVVVGLSGSRIWWWLRAWLQGVGRWVHIEKPEALYSCLKTANVFLYMAGGEENEDALIRAAAAHSPIIANDTSLTRALIKDGVNGIVVEKPTAEAFVQAIVRMNQSAEREIFRVNSSLYVHDTVLATPEQIVAALQSLWEYAEEPERAQEMPPLHPHPVAPPPPTRLEKFKEIWKEMFPSKKDSGLPVSNKMG